MRRPIPTTNILTAVLLVSVLATAGLFFYYDYNLLTLAELERDAVRLQGEVTVVNRDRLMLQSLLNETSEYARRSPALENLLRQHGPLLAEMGFARITNSPATKPVTR